MGEDAELTRRVRDGDDEAVAELYRRHHRPVLAYAAYLCRDPQHAEDLASEAFTRTLRTVRSGSGGPSEGWRPYLCAVVRNTAAEWSRSDRRLVLTDEFADRAEPEPGSDDAAVLALQAYQSLPERWRTVLWHTLIEEEKPEQIAAVLGTTPGHVGVLAFRARENLRRAYLRAHLPADASPGCLLFADELAGSVRRPRSRRGRALQSHLDTCAVCAQAHTRLRDLNTTLKAALPLGVLLPAASVGGTGLAAKAGLVKAGLLKAVPVKAAPVWVTGGAVAATLVTAALVMPADREPRPRVHPAAALPERPTFTSPPVELMPKRAATQAVAGARITGPVPGRCVGVSASAVTALPCDDPRTAWRRSSGPRFPLVNVVDGRCLAAGEHYAPASFNGGGIWTIVLARCGSARARWSVPRFSDGVPRLVNTATDAALSLGKTISGRPAPTSLIAYGAYTDSADQHVDVAAP